MQHPQHPLAHLLITLAYAGELTEAQVRRLAAPEKSAQSIRALLVTLRVQGLVLHRTGDEMLPKTSFWAAKRSALTQPPLCNHPARPLTVVQRRPAFQLGHQHLVSEALVRIVELARPQGLSGLYVRRQIRTQAQNFGGRSIDALAILRWADAPAPNPCPWTRAPWQEGMRQFILTLHALRGTLNRTLVRQKVVFYKQWYGAWQRRFLFRPLPIWVAETEAHRELLQELWPAHWPAGACLITSLVGLAADQWWRWDGQAWHAQALFEDARVCGWVGCGAHVAAGPGTRKAA